MTVFWLRVLIYTLLPILVAGVLARVDPRIGGRERRLETFLIYLFALGVAGSGIGGSWGTSSFPIGWQSPSAGRQAVLFNWRWDSQTSRWLSWASSL